MIDLLFISASSMFAEIITHPIDFIKTQKQYYKKNISFNHIFFNEFKRNGFRGFYTSAPPAIIRQMIYSPIRVNLYENLRNPESNFLEKLVAGCFAGGISQFIVSPTDIIKVKLQTQQLYINKSYNGTQIIKKIYASEGIRGFYNGWLPNV